MNLPSFTRQLTHDLCDSLPKIDHVLHVIIGPRQVGKTTVAQQVVQRLGWVAVMASADSPHPLDSAWIETQWALAMAKMQTAKMPVILVLDEIQKVRGWSETLKQLWDSHKAIQSKFRVLILGSSSIMVQKGLTESLAGRFFMHRLMHWSLEECREAFGMTLPEWLYFGGYPGAVPFVQEEGQWKRYIQDALIETVISKDVLHLEPITKPILMRHLFVLAAGYPSQIVSYTKMVANLQDAGNTTTLSHYVKLLEAAFLVSGLEQFSKGIIRKRGSSPKLIVWNNALVNALSSQTFDQAQANKSWWGRLVENAVGAHLLTQLDPLMYRIFYWRKGENEVDFVVTHADQIWALEVKSGASKSLEGLRQFKANYPSAKRLLIGGDGIPLEDFFTANPRQWFATSNTALS